MPLMGQLEGIKAIPGAVLMNWPAWFGFSLTNMAAGVVLRMIPQLGGTVGLVEQAAVSGMVQVIDHVAWEKLRVA